MKKKKQKVELGLNPFSNDPPEAPIQAMADPVVAPSPSSRSGITKPMSFSMTAKDETALLRFARLADSLNPKLKINKRWNVSSMAKLCIRLAETHIDHIPAIEKIMLELKEEDPRGKR
tara:strand:+ start:1560 stop:1913 length:354 start_codon:yes stop_codon:yes gene_type:complete